MHGLRHTHASILLYQGVNILSVSKRLGHSSLETTMSTYLHIVRELEDQDKEKSMLCSIVYIKMITSLAHFWHKHKTNPCITKDTGVICTFLTGIEPATYRLGGDCSILLSYRNNFNKSIVACLFLLASLSAKKSAYKLGKTFPLVLNR